MILHHSITHFRRCKGHAAAMCVIYKQTFQRRRAGGAGPAVHGEGRGRPPSGRAALRNVHSLFISTHSPTYRNSRMRNEHLKTRKVKITHHGIAQCRTPITSVSGESLIGSEAPGARRRAVRHRMADALPAVYFGTAALLRHISAVSPARGARS